MKKDIRYVPTPLHIVNAMLDLGELRPDDFLIDLGSGDGRIPIQAALRGARARGVEIDGSLARRSQYNAMEAQVDHRVEFLVEDMFRADISEATLLTLYLSVMAFSFGESSSLGSIDNLSDFWNACIGSFGNGLHKLQHFSVGLIDVGTIFHQMILGFFFLSLATLQVERLNH